MILEALERALAKHRAGQLEEAEKAYRGLMKDDETRADACNLLGMLLCETGREPEAELLFAEATQLQPENLSCLVNYASVLAALGKLDQSQAVYQEAVRLYPMSAASNARYGLFLAQTNRAVEAEPYLARSTELESNEPALWINYGKVQRELGKVLEATESFEKALALSPDNPVAWNCLGEARQAKGKRTEALRAFRKAHKLDPENPLYLGNLGLSLSAAGRLGAAIKRLRESLDRRPEDPNIMASLAAALRDACQIEEAVAVFRTALERLPDNRVIVSKYLYTLNFLPGMGRKEIEEQHLMTRRCYEEVVGHPVTRTRAADEPLNVAFLSGDFCAHSVAYFLLHLFEHANRERLRLFAYSEASSEDSINRRFRKAADGWRETAGRSVTEVNEWMREDGIDIVVDLAGHTAGGRLDIIAGCDAQLVFNWLGYPNRVGLSRYDGRLVDSASDPESSDQGLGKERLRRLDPCFLAYRSPYKLPEVKPPPVLQNGYITFGSFNNGAKVNGPLIDLWSRLLLRTPGSRLLLKSWQFSDDELSNRLLDRFAQHGISPDRIMFRGRCLRYREHMSAYGDVDIALDTFPYNGTTSTCEALWMGVPVVSLVGERHAARVGSSLLRAMGRSEWLASTEDEYIDIASDLASSPELLSHLRSEQREKGHCSPLGDFEGFARRMESFMRKAYQEALATRKADVDRIVESGLVAHQAGKHAKALECYELALRENPQLAEVLRYAGVASYALRRFADAERYFARAAREAPERADVLTQWGSALQMLGKSHEAVATHEKALKLNATDPVILSNYGNALSDLGRTEEAAEAFRRSLAVAPRNALAWVNYSVALKDLGRLTEALSAAREAVKVGPSFSGAYSNLGSMLVSLGEADDAIPVLRKATELAGHNHWAWSNLIYALQYSDRSTLDEISDACGRFARSLSGSDCLTPAPRERDKLRIGFISPDLRQHAVARFLKPLLMSRGKHPVEVYLYSDSRGIDRWSDQLRALCEGWRRIFGMSDHDVAALVVADEIDFLVDLAGHSARNRLPLFAMKPASVQATWLGFPGSTGLAEVDFRIADSVILGQNEVSLFPEEPLLLEGGCHSIDLSEAGEVVESPCLKREDFTFGSFNNVAKVGPKTIALWARILRQAPGAVLALKAYQLQDEAFRETLLAKFEAKGVARNRLRLMEPVNGYREHLASYAEIDLCLDPFPYHGTTTTCEALMMGVPTITLVGDRSCSRVGASLLSQVGLSRFVCEDEDAYVDAAVSWMDRSEELDALRKRLRGMIERSTLGDGAHFAETFFGAIRRGYEQAIESLRKSELEPFPEGWVERMRLGSRMTDGSVVYPNIDSLLPSSLAGKRVLDASCVDGYWALEACRRGADETVCLPAEGFYSMDESGTLLLDRESYFQRARKESGVAAERLQLLPLQLYGVEVDSIGRFDWALLMVNVNQLRHLLFALDIVRGLCREGLVMGMLLDSGEAIEERSRAIFLEKGPFWVPTVEGLEALARAAGFELEAVEQYPLEAGRILAYARFKAID